MTPTDSLPPSFRPGSDGPADRRRIRREPPPQPAATGRPTPRRRSTEGRFPPAGAASPSQAGATRAMPSETRAVPGETRAMRRPAVPNRPRPVEPTRALPVPGATSPADPDGPHSHARPGSSAVPMGGPADAGAPEPTRVIPVSSRSRGASVFPESGGTSVLPSPERTSVFPESGGTSVFPNSGAPSAPSRPEPWRPESRRPEPWRSAPSAGEPFPPPRPEPAPRPAPAPRPVPPGQAPPRRRRRLRPLRWIAVVLVLLIVLVAARAVLLWHRVEDGVGRVDALSGAADTDGETWLIVGSDARSSGGPVQDETEGARADSIMLLHKAPNGKAALISLPRDTYVEIPDEGGDKINAAYSYGGPKLLVRTVEELSGLTVDHYVEVGMGGVQEMVDAVDGVEVCLDYDVDDPDSGLTWDTSQGTCQTVDGTRALAYSRMRKSDPTGDIGRGLRQRAVISAVVSKAMGVQTLVNLSRQDALVDAGTGALTIDRDSGTSSLFGMLMAFRSASSDGLTGAPPIESLDYEPGGIGAAVLLQDETAPDFFAKPREGEPTTSDFNQT